MLTFGGWWRSPEKVTGSEDSRAAIKEAANRIFPLTAVLAHNLGRTLQMVARAPSWRTTAKCSPLWTFVQPRTMRNDFPLRAGRFLNRSGKTCFPS